MKKPFEIPNILESLRRSHDSGEMTLRQVAIELHQAGWSNAIDETKSRELISGTRDVAQRICNAETNFVKNAVEGFGITKPEAEKVLRVFIKTKAVKLDAVAESIG